MERVLEPPMEREVERERSRNKIDSTLAQLAQALARGLSYLI